MLMEAIPAKVLLREVRVGGAALRRMFGDDGRDDGRDDGHDDGRDGGRGGVEESSAVMVGKRIQGVQKIEEAGQLIPAV